jgi:iron complex transport system substrate-binding protein
MKNRTPIAAALITLIAAGALAQSQEQHREDTPSHRIISLDASSTETLFALGVSESVVGRDSASTFPPETEEIPIIGDMFSFNPEAILAEDPTLIVANPNRMRHQTVEQLRGVGVELLLVPDEATAESAIAKVRAIAQAVDRLAEGEAIVAAIEDDLSTLSERIAANSDESMLRVLSIIAMGNQILVLGEESHLVGMVHLVGAESAVPELGHYSPINAEAVISAAPDVILLGASSEEMAARVDELLAMPSIALTPAGQNRRIVAMDALFLSGFGPRTGRAALDLHHGLFEVEGPYLSGVR